MPKENNKINYKDLTLVIILNILVIIASILIYNAYVVSPKINTNNQNNFPVNMNGTTTSLNNIIN